MGVAAMSKSRESKPAKAKPKLAVVKPEPIIVAADPVADAWREIEAKLKTPHRPLAARLHNVEAPADGIARCYGHLVALLTARRHELGIPQEKLDDLAGFQDGYTGKLERPESDAGRSAVHITFDMWLGGLGVGLRVVPL